MKYLDSLLSTTQDRTQLQDHGPSISQIIFIVRNYNFGSYMRAKCDKLVGNIL